ncbi:hypothetical protein GTO89_12605 [Heliobacterium gestii]|uniref:NlpC/P60 domain-containing protein n=1 Tax=Heliomicrobium gestii TaxID=2699 RepID=A0A845LFY2_HELGE|nr:C40 family peptidase [Heliomicrobium gestii]MBM7867583.1 hypothetical protein [Heliomicrobium gestii]MZP43870.1 hypothetical protein [Heliomicrobium gestii]
MAESTTTVNQGASHGEALKTAPEAMPGTMGITPEAMPGTTAISIVEQVVCRSLADVWSDWTEKRERVTQAWLGSRVEVVAGEQEPRDGWRKVRLPDQGDYDGWMRVEDVTHLAITDPSPLCVITEPVVKVAPSSPTLQGGFFSDRQGPTPFSELSREGEDEDWLPMGVRLPLMECSGGAAALQMFDGSLRWAPEEAIGRWPSADRQSGQGVLHLAAKFLGRPYLWGGMGWPGIDCSGLVFIAFWTSGIQIPRDAGDQWAASEAIEEEEASPGDLIFFSSQPPQLDHVGLVAGERTFLHASSSLGGVCYSKWDESRWRDMRVGFRRVAGLRQK